MIVRLPMPPKLRRQTALISSERFCEYARFGAVRCSADLDCSGVDPGSLKSISVDYRRKFLMANTRATVHQVAVHRAAMSQRHVSCLMPLYITRLHIAQSYIARSYITQLHIAQLCIARQMLGASARMRFGLDDHCNRVIYLRARNNRGSPPWRRMGRGLSGNKIERELGDTPVSCGRVCFF